MNKLYPSCHAVGTITLNNSVGGINPSAVEMAGLSGAKLVWFPTCDSAHELSHVFDGNPNKKLPYWAQIVIQMKESGVYTPPIELLKDGKLSEETHKVLSVIAKYNMILATGHISHAEAFALVRAAKEHGVERIIVTHVDFPTTFYTVEEQKEFIKLGAYMEHCYTTWATGKVAFEETIAQISAVGPEHVVLATDLGQKTALYPDEGMLEFARRLHLEGGFSERQIRLMTVDNSAALVK
ncbi:hypothetical protein SDC9_149414 [bioreactor metagenome]|uniref:Amidohydrolase-related domain-containing protein n=1 Tax=bioreactor metagenome TaxID=1076179 RepID=A0A645ELI9_9ZZZZ